MFRQSNLPIQAGVSKTEFALLGVSDDLDALCDRILLRYLANQLSGEGPNRMWSLLGYAIGGHRLGSFERRQ